MAIALKTELLGSRDITESSDGIADILVYRVEGSNDPHVVLAAAPTLGFNIGGFHPVYGSRGILRTVNVRQDEGAPQYCFLEASYSPPEAGGGEDFNEVGERWEWNMVARQTQITNVEKQKFAEGVSSYVYKQWEGTTELAEHKRDTAIGREGDRIVGASVYRPFGSVRCTKRFENKSSVSSTYRKKLYELENTLNNSTFIDWDLNECLFMGSSIRYPGDASAEVTYNFLFGVGQPGVKVDVLYSGGGNFNTEELTIDLVRPFQILAFEMGSRVSSTDLNETVTAPRKVGLYEVYPTADFSELGLTGP